MDGSDRCFPASSANVYFTDPKCTLAVAIDPSPCEAGAPKYASLVDYGSCPYRYHLYPVLGAAATVPIYMKTSTGGCNPYPNTLPLLSVGAEIAPSVLAGATFQLD